MKVIILCFAAALVGMADEKSVSLKDLPPAVRKAVQEQTHGATIKGLSMETEDGVTTYEAETMVNGKRRDFEFDSKGALREIEDEVEIATVPAAARATIARKAAGGRVVMVESVTSKGAIVSYEAAYIDKNGRKREVRVKADGTIVPD